MLLRIATLIASGISSYASVSSTSQLWGSTIAHAPADKIALTFDDGPNGDTTLRLLDILAAASCPATFFVIGHYAQTQPDILRRIAAAGHTIGNHTDSHANLFWASPSRTREEIRRCQQTIEDCIGVSVTLFRPPFGTRRPDTLHIVRELNLTPILWNVKCYDWRNRVSATRVLECAQRGIARNTRRHRGSLILLHDGGHLALNMDRSATLTATRQLLATYEPARFIAL
ncbi:MAG: hypothetical protein NVS9B15_07320 [Acidobacteriaceae bacterium]